jgi:hypothetical protein
MHRLLILLLIFFATAASAQKAFLFVKRGHKKVASFPEGSAIRITTAEGTFEGFMTFLRRDTIFMNGVGIAARDVRRVYNIQVGPHWTWKQFFYTTAGIGLSTLALRITTKTQVPSSAVFLSQISYGSFVVKGLYHRLRNGRQQYPVGRRFRLQVFDLRPF